MPNAASFDPFIDALVERVADRVAAKLESQRGGAASATAIVPALLNLDQAAAYLGRSRRAIEHLIADRRLRSVRDGARRFVRREDADCFIASLVADETAEP